jgi:hypothetical protein
LDDAYKTHSAVDDNASACIDLPVGHDKRSDYIRFHSCDYDDTGGDCYYIRTKRRGDTVDGSRVECCHRLNLKLNLKMKGVAGTTAMTRTVYTVLQFRSFYKMTVKWV